MFTQSIFMRLCVLVSWWQSIESHEGSKAQRYTKLNNLHFGIFKLFLDKFPGNGFGSCLNGAEINPGRQFFPGKIRAVPQDFVR